MFKAQRHEAYCPIWPEIELVRDFVPAFIKCKFEEGPIENECAILSATFFRRSRADNFEVNIWMCQELELVRDITALLVTCKFDDDPIQKRRYHVHNISFRSPRAHSFEVNRRMWAEFILVRDFMAVLCVLVTCKFDDDPIKKEGAIVSSTFSPL